MADRVLWQFGAVQAAQLTVLAIAIALMVRFLARNRPHLAYALWLVVLLKCVTPPLLASPTSIFCWLRCSTEASTAAIEHSPTAWAESVVTLQRDAVSANDKGAPGAGLDADDVPFASPGVADELATASVATAPLAGRSIAHPWRLGEVLLVVWLSGALLAVASSAVRLALCLRRLHGNAHREDPALDELVASLVQRLGLRRSVRLLVTESRVGPAVLGLLRPTIVLPACVVAGKSAVDLEPVLAHELIHVRRGDLWAGLLQIVAQAAWWFHPLVWLAGRAAVREAERCCDEEVVGSLGYTPAQYARGLLDVLELKRVLVALPAFPGVRPVEVTSQRLERIMSLGQGCRRRAGWSYWAIMLVVAAATLPGAALVVGGEEVASPAAAAPQQPGVAPGYGTAFPNPATARATAERPIPTSWIEKSYEAADLLATFKKATGYDDDAGAKKCLLSQLELELAVKRNARQIMGSGILPLAKSPDDASKASQDLERGPALAWSGTTIVARYAPAGQERIAQALAQLRSFNFARMIEVQVSFLTGPEAIINKLSPNWQLAPAADECDTDADQEIDTAELRGAERPQHSHAALTVERRLPVMLEVLDDAAARALVERFRSQIGPRAALQAPRVLLYGGQTAFVSELSQTPFVVGMNDKVPQIRVVNQGTAVRLRAALHQEVVRLDYDLLLQTIGSVDTAEMPGAEGEEPIKLQVPEVARARFRSWGDVPLGKTLLVGGLARLGDKGSSESVAVLLKVSVPPAEPADKISDSGENRNKPVQQDLPEPNTNALAAGMAPQRQAIRYVKIFGSTTSSKTLAKKAGLNVGDLLDAAAVERGRQNLESYLRGKAAEDCRVAILEGDRRGDQGVVLLVHSGTTPKMAGFGFQLTSTAKRPQRVTLKGGIDRQRADEYTRRLTEYYRGLGFLQARIAREWTYNEEQDATTVTLLPEPGVRYTIADISFLGNRALTAPLLQSELHMKVGDFFDQGKIDNDQAGLTAHYADEGFLFAEVKLQVRAHDQPDAVDLVYKIDEGARYRVAAVGITLKGPYEDIRRDTMRQSLGLDSGDVVNLSKLQAVATRIKGSVELLPATNQRQARVVIRGLPGAGPEGDALSDGESIEIELSAHDR